MINKTFSWGFLFWLFLLPGVIFAEGSNRIVAVVNNEIITYYELEKAFRSLNPAVTEKADNEEIKKQVLLQLIERKLVDLQIKKLGINTPAEEVERSIERLREEQGLTNQEDFLAALNKDGLTLAEFKERIKEQILRVKLINREIGSKIVIPETSLMEYYKENKSKFEVAGGAHLAHILFLTSEGSSKEEKMAQKTKADNMISRLKKGESFKELAKKFSQGESASQGGDLGLIKWEDFDPGLKKILTPLKPGEFSEVIETPQGWQIFQVISLQEDKVQSFEEVKDRIREIFFQKEIDDRYNQWLQQLKARSNIQILL